MCVWLFKLNDPLPVVIGGGIGALVLLSGTARWAIDQARASS
ncbi:MAG: hypothetical protein ACOYZ7_06360 [Chloroflexota bacterium]